MKRLGILVREDADQKPGGDVSLANEFSRLLSAKYLPHVVRPSEFDVGAFDAVILFNIDQPHEPYRVAKTCVANDVPFYLYPLHHKSEYVKRYIREGTSGLQRTVAQITGFNPILYETLVGALRLTVSGRVSELLHYRGMSVAARFLVTRARAVCVSSIAEAGSIAEDFSIPNASYSVVRHVFESSNAGFHRTPATSRPLILCAGRIEPRKNQLALARVARTLDDCDVLFVGKANDNHPTYFRELTAEIEGAPHMSWLDQVDLPTLLSLIKRAAAYVNVSWFEVFSLIDLMALAAGTPCVLSSGSYIKEEFATLPNNVTFVEPYNCDAWECAIRSATKHSSETGMAFDTSWSRAGVASSWDALLAATS